MTIRPKSLAPQEKNCTNPYTFCQYFYITLASGFIMTAENSLMPQRYLLERFQLVPCPRDDVFAFFAKAANLETLTPAFLNFEILTPQPIAIQQGTLIDYKLRLFRIPFHWHTRIDLFEPPWRFADRQIRGPYRHWYHVHEFQDVPGGTQMRDRVEYALPFGFLGRLMHRLIVRRTLERIFDYRYNRLCALFPPHSEVPAGRPSHKTV